MINLSITKGAFLRGFFALCAMAVVLPSFGQTCSSCSNCVVTEDCDTAGRCKNFGSYPQTGCPPNYAAIGCSCCSRQTPLLIDVDGKGFQLTDLSHGVLFDIGNAGKKPEISWTSSASTNAWLALDRNGNGLIDDGTELFGDMTPQPKPPKGLKRNGILALAEYDKPENGGNGDGVIDASDAVFGRLLLWNDRNHDGISQSSELSTLSRAGIRQLELSYEESRKKDQYGNEFRYRVKIHYSAPTGSFWRWAYDVILLLGPPPRAT